MLMNPSAVTTGTGPAGARPCLTPGHLAGPRLLEEWSQTKTQSGSLSAEAVSVVLGPLRAVTHVGKACRDDPGRQGRQGSVHDSPSFFHPTPLVPGPRLGGSWASKSPPMRFHGLLLYS